MKNELFIDFNSSEGSDYSYSKLIEWLVRDSPLPEGGISVEEMDIQDAIAGSIDHDSEEINLLKFHWEYLYKKFSSLSLPQREKEIVKFYRNIKQKILNG